MRWLQFLFVNNKKITLKLSSYEQANIQFHHHPHDANTQMWTNMKYEHDRYDKCKPYTQCGELLKRCWDLQLPVRWGLILSFSRESNINVDFGLSLRVWDLTLKSDISSSFCHLFSLVCCPSVCHNGTIGSHLSVNLFIPIVLHWNVNRDIWAPSFFCKGCWLFKFDLRLQFLFSSLGSVYELKPQKHPNEYPLCILCVLCLCAIWAL